MFVLGDLFQPSLRKTPSLVQKFVNYGKSLLTLAPGALFLGWLLPLPTKIDYERLVKGQTDELIFPEHQLINRMTTDVNVIQFFCVAHVPDKYVCVLVPFR